jgi:hypothetical protein
VGFFVFFLLEFVFKVEVSKLFRSVTNLVVVSLVAFVVYPKVLGIPFGRIDTRTFLRKVGFFLPNNGWKHILLGLVLAFFTLSGMLTASILSGKYQMDLSTINLSHLLFSLNPALWEELFYRGVLMILLLKLTGSFRKAFIIQVLVFGLLHIKGFDFWSLVDAFTVGVIAIGFTYTAYKTQALAAGIVFHYFHDAFLFFVQLPKGVPSSTADNAVFYGLLWLMVGIGCLIIRLAVDVFGVQAPTPFYTLESVTEDTGAIIGVDTSEPLQNHA